MYSRSLSRRFSMLRGMLNSFYPLTDAQQGPQEPDFAVTKLVAVLIFDVFCPQGPREVPTRLPRATQLLGNRNSVTPRTLHAAYGRGKTRRKIERALNGLGSVLAALGGIEIAHQKGS